MCQKVCNQPINVNIAPKWAQDGMSSLSVMTQISQQDHWISGLLLSNNQLLFISSAWRKIVRNWGNHAMVYPQRRNAKPPASQRTGTYAGMCRETPETDTWKDTGWMGATEAGGRHITLQASSWDLSGRPQTALQLLLGRGQGMRESASIWALPHLPPKLHSVWCSALGA